MKKHAIKIHGVYIRKHHLFVKLFSFPRYFHIHLIAPHRCVSIYLNAKRYLVVAKSKYVSNFDEINASLMHESL